MKTEKSLMSLFPRNRIAVDLILILVFSILLFVFSSVFEVFDQFMHWSRNHETWQIDELFSLLACLSIAWFFFSMQRVKELRGEVAKRKQFMESLQETIEINQLILDHPGSLTTLYNPDGILQMINLPGAKSLGGLPEDFVGKSIYELFPDHADHYRERNRQVIDTGIGAEFEDMLELPSGKRWFWSNLQPAKNADGKTVAVQIVSHDITERKRVEDALRESQEKYRLLFDSFPESITMIGLDGTILDCNDRTRKTSALSEKEMLGKSFTGLETLEQDKIQEYIEIFSRLARGEDVEPFQLKTIPSVNETRWHEIFASSLKKDGKVIAIQVINRDITEKKQAEEALRESEEKWRSLVENAPDIIMNVERDGTILFLNNIVEGFTREQVVGTSVYDYVLPEYCDTMRNSIERVFQTGVVDNYESTGLGHQGTISYYESRVVPVKCDGQVISVNLIATDVTDRKRVEKRVQRKNAALKAINEVFQKTLKCETVGEVAKTCLSVCEKLTGSKFSLLGELNKEGRFDTLAYTDPGMEACRMTEEQAWQKSLDMEVRGVWAQPIIQEKSMIIEDPASHPASVGTPKGHPPITAFLGVPLRSGGKVFGMMGLANKEGGYTQEDLDAVEALSLALVEALHRKRAEVANKESEEKYRELVENANDAIFVIQDGFLKFHNKKTEELIGYSGEELDKIPFIEHVYPEDREMVLENNIRRLKGKEIPSTYSLRIKDKAGKTVWGELNAVRILWEGNPAVLCFVRDTTEQKTLETQLQQSQKMEAIGALAGGIAHDFNNLMTVVTGYSEIALMGLNNNDSLCNMIEEVKKAGERAASLTGQLLAFSRKQIIQPKILILNELINEFDKMLRPLVREDLQLVTVLEPALWRVKADPGQIEQVIMNLVVNAKDAMTQGGRITIETNNFQLDKMYADHHTDVPPGPYVMLAVSDTGIGMNEETKQHIFEPFFSTKEKDNGTGLGLSTVYGIVKQNNGHIWVYSEPGKGTTFKIYLPRVEGEKEELAKLGTDPLETQLGVETILVVEDEDALRKMICDILEPSGYTVFEASSGGEALSFCERYEKHIHLMITDVIMPQMSGPELYDRLTALRPELKVIYISGYTDHAIALHGVLGPGIPFLQKPFSVNALIQNVHKVLNSSDKGTTEIGVEIHAKQIGFHVPSGRRPAGPGGAGKKN